MDTGPNPAIEQHTSWEVTAAPVPPTRPFQYSLWSLMVLVSFTGPIIAAACGALGEVAQASFFTILFLLICAASMAGFFLMVSCPVFWLLNWIEESRRSRHTPPPEHQAQNAPSQLKSADPRN